MVALPIAFLLAAAAPSAAASASTAAEEAAAAERLAARALDVLDGMLGPGRAKVSVEVKGERTDVRSETEIVSPIELNSAAGKAAREALSLPGYGKDSPKDDAKKGGPAGSYFQRDHEQSVRDNGFTVKSIQATVVLDSALDDALAREASQLLPQLLRIDGSRGDALTILRAPLRPAWKSAFATPADWRAAVWAAEAALVALAAALIGGFALVRAGRALGSELSTLRADIDQRNTESSAEALPELTPGAPPGLLEAGGALGLAGPGQGLLGRRFDFLLAREPALIARALSAEKPEELSLFFGHLSESIPELASKLFAHLPSDVQAEVSQSLLRLTIADPDRLSALEERLRQAVEHGVQGPQSLARILSRVPGEARSELLERIAARDAGGAEEVQKHVFSFEDLQGLGAADLRRLLAALPYEVWGAALRGAPAGLIERVLADLPEGPRDLVRESAASPQAREKVNAARSKVLDALLALEAKGELKLDRDGGEVV